MCKPHSRRCGGGTTPGGRVPFGRRPGRCADCPSIAGEICPGVCAQGGWGLEPPPCHARSTAGPFRPVFVRGRRVRIGRARPTTPLPMRSWMRWPTIADHADYPDRRSIGVRGQALELPPRAMWPNAATWRASACSRPTKASPFWKTRLRRITCKWWPFVSTGNNCPRAGRNVPCSRD